MQKLGRAVKFQYSLGAKLLSSPQDLDGAYDNSSVIVVGSVIQLFCSASGQLTAPHIQWTRNNITIPETAQLPHLMVKSRTQNNTITSSLLSIYGFSSSDNGSYQCVACDKSSCNTNIPLLLSASSGSNVLLITRELISNTADRTSVPLGSSDTSSNGSFLRCSAEQPASSSLTAPSIKWLKDGTQLFGDGDIKRAVSFVRIFNFSQSDAGVYQCVFYDTPSQGGEVVTTRPYKVDTGPVNLKALSPSVVTLCPPDPLVIQVEAGGEYADIQWTRTPIALNVSNGELVDFQQTFVRTVTSVGNWGLYQVSFQIIQATPLLLSYQSFPHSTAPQQPAAQPLLIVAVTILGGVVLILILFLLVAGVGVTKRRWKEKQFFNV
eukprot:Em0004g1294a